MPERTLIAVEVIATHDGLTTEQLYERITDALTGYEITEDGTSAAAPVVSFDSVETFAAEPLGERPA